MKLMGVGDIESEVFGLFFCARFFLMPIFLPGRYLIIDILIFKSINPFFYLIWIEKLFIYCSIFTIFFFLIFIVEEI